ncbi:hypothetical protein L484_001461 [Morus notabilis]|uniref:Uncharacterized protein n=1 Tax=Morus notabilis TaxID=981085 RepID=W9SL92_9ROSA|nr:hypothetical protein L484_001461 [Morus notabilis]
MGESKIVFRRYVTSLKDISTTSGWHGSVVYILSESMCSDYHQCFKDIELDILETMFGEYEIKARQNAVKTVKDNKDYV